MEHTETIRTIAFGLISAVVLVSALWVVTLKNLFRAALSLGLVLLGVAGLFLLLGAEFLAFVQILVYVGAILTMVIFAIMLTGKLQTTADAPERSAGLLAAAASGALFALLSAATWTFPWPEQSAGDWITAAAMGQQLVTTLVLPFEVVSFVFVAAMIGAMVVAVGKGTGDSGSR